MLRFIETVIRREFLLAFRRPADLISVLFFFIIASSLFPLGVWPRVDTWLQLAPGVLWVSALLATLLSLPHLFADDYRDGTLEQLVLGAYPLAFAVFGKLVAHWLVFGVSLALLAPVFAFQFDLPGHALWTLFLSLFVGTPALSSLGAIGAALTLGLRGGRVVLSLLVLPLYIPVLIFGAAAVEAALAGIDANAGISFLAALSLAGMFFTPPLIAAALHITME
ncbi:MAG: heme exporter protein CcmB [Candidatus Accumulibacter sp.]|jgi:heme exporter protein B|nr:heme exporter protein CcmB [Accumulibacter sp.]